MIIEIPNDGSGLGRSFIENGKRIGFVHSVTIEPRDDMVFKERSLADVWKKSLPDARLPFRRQPVAALIPAIEIADNGDLFAVRRPNGEIGAARAGVCDDARAEFVVEPKMAALVKEV